MTVVDKLISEFSLTPNVTLGKKLDFSKSKGIRLIKEQEGDIPAIYNVDYEGFVVEVNVINEIVYGFILRLDSRPHLSFSIKVKNDSFLISNDTNFLDFIHFLNNSDIFWKVSKRDTMDQRIVVSVNSKLDFFFLLDKDDWGLFRVSVADIELYESLL